MNTEKQKPMTRKEYERMKENIDKDLQQVSLFDIRRKRDDQSDRIEMYYSAYGDYTFSLDEIDFDNPDIDFIRKVVWDDFAHKLWILFYENPFRKRYGCDIYNQLFKRFIQQGWDHYFSEAKRRDIKVETADQFMEFKQHIASYFNAMLSKTYLPMVNYKMTTDEIWDRFGGGEFPGLDAILVKFDNGHDQGVRLFYTATR